MRSYEYVDTVEEAKAFLERGQAVEVSSGCIGHNRHCAEQESYKAELQEYYGDALEIDCTMGVCRYSYIFRLK